MTTTCWLWPLATVPLPGLSCRPLALQAKVPGALPTLLTTNDTEGGLGMMPKSGGPEKLITATAAVVTGALVTGGVVVWLPTVSGVVTSADDDGVDVVDASSGTVVDSAIVVEVLDVLESASVVLEALGALAVVIGTCVVLELVATSLLLPPP